MPQFFSFMVETGKGGRPPMIRCASSRGQSDRFQTIDRQRFTVPWAPVPRLRRPQLEVPVPDLAGGVAKRGEVLFFSEQGRCSQCHAIGGRGGTVGPDLTDIGRKGKEQIYRSIAAPSAEIAPDYVPYTVATRDGRIFAGVVRAEGADAIRVIDTDAKTTTLRRDEIDQIRPSGTSIMPVGLAGGLGEAGVRDLIAYLTSPGELPRLASWPLDRCENRPDAILAQPPSVCWNGTSRYVRAHSFMKRTRVGTTR